MKKKKKDGGEEEGDKAQTKLKTKNNERSYKKTRQWR